MAAAKKPEIIVALPTAFDRDGQLDVDGTREIFRKTAQSGVDGGLVLGTTGEFPSLSFDERGEIARAAVEELAGIRCIIHVGAASRFEVVKLIDQARELGVSEIAVITPYFLPATDQALRDFYTAVSEASDGMSVYVYVFRARTGNFVSPQLMAALAALPNVVGAKISGESLDQIAEYRATVPSDFVLYTGSDRDIARAASHGAQGVISGIASTLPRPFTEIAALIDGGADRAALDDSQAAVDDAVDTVGGDMANMKAALRLQGVDAGYPRMAIDEPSEEKLIELKRAVGLYDFLAN